ERELLAERDVLLAPDEERGRGDPGPVLEPLAEPLDRPVAVHETAQPLRPHGARVGAPEDSAVVVDAGAQRAGPARRVAQLLEVRLVERVLAHRRAADGRGDRARVPEAEEGLREPGDLEEEHVPAARQLAAVRLQL